MKLIVHTFFAVLLVAAFRLVAHFEQRLPGDLEWIICFGIVFVSSFIVYLLTKSWQIILTIAALAPLSILGMFFLVNIFFSATTSAAGLGLAAFSERVWRFLNSRADD